VLLLVIAHARTLASLHPLRLLAFAEKLPSSCLAMLTLATVMTSADLPGPDGPEILEGALVGITAALALLFVLLWLQLPGGSATAKARRLTCGRAFGLLPHRYVQPPPLPPHRPRHHAGHSFVNAQTASPRKLRKAIMMGTLGLKNLSLVDRLKAAKEAGCDGVEANGGMNQQEVIDALRPDGHSKPPASAATRTGSRRSPTPMRPSREAGLARRPDQTLRDAKAYGAAFDPWSRRRVQRRGAYDRGLGTLASRRSKGCAAGKGTRVCRSRSKTSGTISSSVPLEAVRYLDEIGEPPSWVGISTLATCCATAGRSSGSRC